MCGTPQRIPLLLREAAVEGEGGTGLMISDFLFPLACVNHFSIGSKGKDDTVDDAEGGDTLLASLTNLGNASANVYWMDVTVRSLFSFGFDDPR